LSNKDYFIFIITTTPEMEPMTETQRTQLKTLITGIEGVKKIKLATMKILTDLGFDKGPQAVKGYQIP
jgi:hypothetical protein